jgi:hypothetical protein
VIFVTKLRRGREKLMRGPFALAAACGAVLVLAASATATPPERFTDSFDYSGTTDCGTFVDVFEGSVEARGMTTFDKAGNPVKDIVHVTRKETNWRADDATVRFSMTSSFNVVYDYATDTETNDGLVFRQTFPGIGLLFHDAGSIIFAPGGAVVHGPHDIFEGGDAVFCDALEAIS